MIGSLAYTWADALIKANAAEELNASSAAKPDVPEWERRPFALSKPEYYSQPYPGTGRARMLKALRDHAEEVE